MNGKIELSSYVSAYETLDMEGVGEDAEDLENQFMAIIHTFHSNPTQQIQKFLNYKQFVYSSLSTPEFLNLKNLQKLFLYMDTENKGFLTYNCFKKVF